MSVTDCTFAATQFLKTLYYPTIDNHNTRGHVFDFYLDPDTSSVCWNGPSAMGPARAIIPAIMEAMPKHTTHNVTQLTVQPVPTAAAAMPSVIAAVEGNASYGHGRVFNFVHRFVLAVKSAGVDAPPPCAQDVKIQQEHFTWTYER
eukprot:PhM_4_TR5662/c0_g1_i1/m.69744/K14285/NXT1_2, P15; NTF2-related export protein 1/2